MVRLNVYTYQPDKQTSVRRGLSRFSVKKLLYIQMRPGELFGETRFYAGCSRYVTKVQELFECRAECHSTQSGAGYEERLNFVCYVLRVTEVKFRNSTNGKKSLSENKSGNWLSIQKVAIIISAVFLIVIPFFLRKR